MYRFDCILTVYYMIIVVLVDIGDNGDDYMYNP
jgi:hypothetical protein